MTTLPTKFLKGAQKAISIGGFRAKLVRNTGTGVNPDDPLGPPVTTTEEKECTVFVDEPRTFYSDAQGLVRIGEGTLYVDLLSISPDVTWFPRDGDKLVYHDGTEQVLTFTQYPAVNGQCVVTISAVTGLGSLVPPPSLAKAFGASFGGAFG